MQMERQEKMDYAAVVREYRTNGGGLKMKEWCQQEGYDYFKVRRYSKRMPSEKSRKLGISVYEE